MVTKEDVGKYVCVPDCGVSGVLLEVHDDRALIHDEDGKYSFYPSAVFVRGKNCEPVMEQKPTRADLDFGLDLSPFHSVQERFAKQFREELEAKLVKQWTPDNFNTVSTWSWPDVKAKPAPPTESFQSRLARVFGLASDAPDDVLLATAEKAWAGESEKAACARKEATDFRDMYNQSLCKRGDLADECGRLGNENARLRAHVGELLLALEEKRSV